MVEPAPPDSPPEPATDRADSRRAFWRVASLVGKIALGICALALAIGLAKFGYDAVKPSTSEKSRTLEAQFTRIGPAAFQEWRLATGDHEIIAAAAAACTKIADLDSLPNYIRAQLRLDLLPNGSIGQSPFDENTRKEPKQFALSNYMRAAIYLSDSISRGRIESAATASDNYSSMFWFQLAIVGIGAITTILISIKSIAPPDSPGKAISLSLWVGILAIIFSSIGTATSALNSFYGPRESYLKSERSLSALRQLHSEIAAKIASSTDPDKCPKLNPASKDDPYGKQIQDWTTRLGGILNASDSGSSSSSNSSSTAPTDLKSRPGSQ
jgi:hypothetical protein